MDEIEGIKQNQEGEIIEGNSIGKNTVRHLGVYFNRNGLINNVGDILKEVETNLNLFKFLYPNFCLKINLVKGYFFSKLNYISSFVSIVPEQIKHCENLIKWFLKGTQKDENGKIVHFSNKRKFRANISLERLCREKV